ncbi:MAG: hypothetical protein MZV70_13845 [Desulfobacterales bacterium]|nr:hypothetical protein [Desulfobacterales bacterium]
MMSLREFFGSSVGAKLVMAATGGILVLFLAGHLLGNASVFSGQESMNASRLQAPRARSLRLDLPDRHDRRLLPPRLLRYPAEPRKQVCETAGYAVRHHLRATFASKAMLQSGLVILGFVIYHLVHFTFQFIDPAVAARMKSGQPGKAQTSTACSSSVSRERSLDPVYGRPRHGLPSPEPRRPKRRPDLRTDQRQDTASHREGRNGCGPHPLCGVLRHPPGDPGGTDEGVGDIGVNNDVTRG